MDSFSHMKVRALLLDLCLFNKISPTWSTENTLQRWTSAEGQSKVPTSALISVSGSGRRLHRWTRPTRSCSCAGAGGAAAGGGGAGGAGKDAVTERQHVLQPTCQERLC